LLFFVLRRLASGVVLLFAISFLAYMLISLPQPDIARQLLGIEATPAQVAAKRQELGLNDPILVQYWHWLSSALRGDLGRSWFTQLPVGSTIAARLPVTLSLMVGATLLTGVVGCGLGAWAGIRRGTVDRIVQIVGVAGHALPGFLLTLVLALVFAVQLGWFPAVGYTPFTTSVSQWLASVTLPVIALSIGAIAGLSQQVRAAVISVMRQDYIRTLRARGLSTRRIVLRHALRNASAPALSILGVHFVALLGGAVVVEQIFGLPGIGSMAMQYTSRGDIPIVMGLLMVAVVCVVCVNLTVDLLIAWLNPRVRQP